MALMVLATILSTCEANNGIDALPQPAKCYEIRFHCPWACQARCADNRKDKLCNRICNICCSKCNCVPPGTGEDTRYLCPCYDEITNSEGSKLKCP
ncbi:hypothetical protein BRADI_3g35225v3 [Brachypodium distachyon]|uniref:Gibberellin regulated protein n=1 Tax=Brachypodium distachyon TaxID=15368 RepID=A0A0Q3ICS3_BRADI|nr:hypothetical protein BRADI_3g35225v3 [Brachypodium distachyon]